MRKLVKDKSRLWSGLSNLARSLKIRKYGKPSLYYERYASWKQQPKRGSIWQNRIVKARYLTNPKPFTIVFLADDLKKSRSTDRHCPNRYATPGSGYIKLLDEIFKDSPDWTRSWLKEEFNFRIYTNDKMGLSPNQAAKFMSYDKIFDLTQRAFHQRDSITF